MADRESGDAESRRSRGRPRAAGSPRDREADVERSAPEEGCTRSRRVALAVEDAGLLRRFGRDESEVPVRRGSSDPAPRRACEKALLHQERLVHLLERSPIFADGGGAGLHAPRPPPETPEYGLVN